MAGIKDTYVVHCAATSCDLGLRDSKLVLGMSHGVYLKDLAQVSIRDQIGVANVICFGGCVSAMNPSTLAVAQQMAAKVAAETGTAVPTDIMGMFTKEGTNGKALSVSGVCTPIIVSPEWDNEKEDVTVATGKKALLGEATLTCSFGGTITVIDTGQPE